MESGKTKQETSLISRIFSMEAMILVVGILFMVSAYLTGDPKQYFWGGTIICGSLALHFVKKKDWKKHWEELEQHRQREDEYRARIKELKEKEKSDQ
jgi:flagellar biosynthesis component FlhA